MIVVGGGGDGSGARCTHRVDCCDPFLALRSFSILLFLISIDFYIYVATLLSLG